MELVCLLSVLSDVTDSPVQTQTNTLGYIFSLTTQSSFKKRPSCFPYINQMFIQAGYLMKTGST